MRLPPHEIDPGMWVKIPNVGTGLVLETIEGNRGKVELLILLEHPLPSADCYVASLYSHDFIEVEKE
jgi:hypothetical protein